MRKQILLCSLVAGLCLMNTPGLLAQAAGSSEAAAGKAAPADEESGLEMWKMINSGIFALLLGFAIYKYAPGFYNARSLDIQKAIKDATGLKIEADFRYSAVDRKMANLAREVERMKAEAALEMEREHQRLKEETAAEIEHIGRNTDYEIDSLRAEGALQVKRHTAQQAFALAERRLQAHFSQHDTQNNVREFVNMVASEKTSGGAK
jgi:F0F1-type ATP synthase membrane subunit b/b'